MQADDTPLGKHHHKIRFWKVIFIAIVLAVMLTLPLD